MRRKIILYGGGFCCAALILFGLWLRHYYAKDHTDTLRAFRETLQRADVVSAEGDSTGLFFDVTLYTGHPVPVRCYVQSPSNPGRHPAVILLGGLNTGRKALQLVGETGLKDRFVIMTMDYPYEGETKKVPVFEVVRNIPDIRAAVFRSAMSVSLLVDYLLTRPDVDPDRIFVAGGSFGAFFAVVSGALDERIRAVAALYGGADISLLIEKNLKWEPAFLRPPAAYIIEALLRPMEPSRYAGRISPRPFLMINGSGDEQIPGESIAKLFDSAREPKELVWYATRHIQHADDRALQEMTEQVADWLIATGLVFGK